MNTIGTPHAHVIVFGNEKGGTGKSTTAMHVIVSLLSQNFKLAAIDLDARQKTLHRYLENRQNYMQEHALRLKLPDSHIIEKSQRATRAEVEREEQEHFNSLLHELEHNNDFIIIDCPGNDTFLARLAHTHADTLITPLNDSFVDLDLLAQIDPDSYEVQKLSLYSEMVWDSRKRRSLTGKRGLDWVVMRNRTSSTDAWNKRHVHKVLTLLQRRVAFRYVAGLGERVVYRELFPKGLTLVDLHDVPNQEKMSMSHIVARQELRSLMGGLRLPRWNAQEVA